MSSKKLDQFLKTFGPGIMFAGTCIGGSHLIQSTKAGAFYGYALIGVVLFANFIKYPFFEFASRYTNATGESILEGYQKLGKWPLRIYALVTLISMFIVCAAIVAVTAGLSNHFAKSYLGLDVPQLVWVGGLMVLVLGLLIKNQFKILDIALKFIGLVLVVTVVSAFFMVLPKPLPEVSPSIFDVVGDFEFGGFAFAIALMGWMPMGVDMSTWHSIWTQERIKQTGYHPSLKQTLLDFKIGYWITIVLAVMFLVIGAKSLYIDKSIAEIKEMSAVAYSGMLVSSFTNCIGAWSGVIVSIAAFSTMFGTTITLSDGYSRSVTRTFELLFGGRGNEKRDYVLWTLALFVGSFVVIYFLGAKLGQLMNLATTISFLIAPVAGYYNYRIVFSPDVPEEKRPSRKLKVLAEVGLVVLSLLSVGYLIDMVI